MRVVSRKSFSLSGLIARAVGEQSARVQKVGMIIVLAPAAMSSRKASGKARSQHISIPTGPMGVEKVRWGSSVEEVR